MPSRPLRSSIALAALLAAGAAPAREALQEAPQEAPQEASAATPAPAAGNPAESSVAQPVARPAEDATGAASLFDPAFLDAKGIARVGRVADHVPNMVGFTSPGVGSAKGYALRGLGAGDVFSGIGPAVGTFVDGIRLSQAASNPGLFDVERIAVLRGPQGLGLGRDTSGGAVDVTLRAPAGQVHGFIDGGIGAYGRIAARGSIDLPIGDMFAFKFSGYIDEDNGHARNTTTGERANETRLAGLRGAMRLRLSERLTWDLALAFMRDDSVNLPDFDCDPRDAGDCDGRFVTTGLRRDSNDFTGLGVSGRKARFGLGNRTDTLLLTSSIRYSGDNHALSLITGYADLQQEYALDLADGRPLPTPAAPSPAVAGHPLGGYTLLNDGRDRRFSQEVRLDGTLAGMLHYAVGGLIEEAKADADTADIRTLPVGLPVAGGPTGVPVLLADRTLNDRLTTRAGYARFDLTAADALTLTAGVRYTDEERRLDARDNRGCVAGPPAPACLTGAAPTLRTKIWTPRLAVAFRPDDALLLFASASRGYRSAGWNLRATRRDALLPYAPETAWSYEGGVGTSLLDGQVRAKLTGFWTDVSDLQASSAIVDATTVAFTAGNVADLRNRGVELEVTATPIKALSLYATAGVQDAEYRLGDGARQQQAACRAQLAAGPAGPACGTGIVTASGGIAEPVRAPTLTAAFGGSYDLVLGQSGGILTPAVDVFYRGAHQTDPANAPGTRAEAAWLVNASLALRTDDDAWLLSIACDNCLDKAVTEASLLGVPYLNAPRSWMLRARRQF